MRLNGFYKFLGPIMLTGLSLLALTVAERRLDDLSQEIGVREDYNSGYRSMKLLGKFKRTKSHSYAPAKAQRHPKPHYYPPPQYAPPKPQYAPSQYGLVAPAKSQHAPPQYGPPKPQYGPPKSQYAPPKSQYAPPKSQYGPPKTNYRAPPHAYGPPQQAYHPSSAYVKPQQSYAAAPPANAIYSPPQQAYAQPSPAYAPHNPAPPPPPPYAQLPVSPVTAFSPSALITYSATEPPLPQTDYNQPALHYHPSSTDDDDDSSESTGSDDSSASSHSESKPDNYEPAEPKPSAQEHSVSDQVEAAPVDTDPPVAIFVSTEASFHQDSPKQTAFIPIYPSYSGATNNNHQETDDPPKETEFISSIPNYSVPETDNNQQADDPPKETESEPPVSSHPEDVNYDIPTISPPISTDEALAYSPNFGDSNAFSDSTDSDFPSLFNPPSTFFKQPENGADGNKNNDFGFFQLGIFPKTSSFFEQNYNG